MDCCVDIVLVICQSVEDLSPVESGFCGAVNCLQSLNGVSLLRFGQELCRAWRVWEEEEDDKREDNGGCTLCLCKLR